jgi:hypothetical protein
MSTAVHVLQRVPSAAAAADGLRKDASTLRFFFFLSIRVKNSSLAERFPADCEEAPASGQAAGPEGGQDPAAQPPDPPGLLHMASHAAAHRARPPFLCAQVYTYL